MVLVCEGCGAKLDPTALIQGEGGLIFRCSVCGREEALSPAAPLAPAPVQGACYDRESCPKCGQASQGPSCPRCGLIFERWNPQGVETDLGSQSPAGVAARSLFDEVLANFADQEAHGRFIRHCQSTGLLSLAAFWYRLALTSGLPAKAHLDQINTVAQFSLGQASPTPSTSPGGRRMRTFLVIIFVMAIIGLVLYGMHYMGYFEALSSPESFMERM